MGESEKMAAFRKKWGAPILALAGLIAFGWFSDSADVSPDHLLIILAIIGIPIAIVVLIIRALLRVGDKRPPPIILQQPTTANPPAGFYPDQAGVMRWFDGQRWTEHTK
ncbi:DUF2510 domain-containing protein [Nocardia elegans]|uniref:DUF2510 domain-containing protein n=1 Tax=Nocardia elegans TaxID=300029 RepID=A0ABW6TLM2_9NOCA